MPADLDTGGRGVPARRERRDPVGARIEVGLAAAQWIQDAAHRLQRGFLLLFDYGHEPGTLYSAAHPAGTLASHRAHRSEDAAWLTTPGDRDLTANVDLAAIRRAAEAAGLLTLAIVDQTYFLLSIGLAARLETGHDRGAVARRVAARTLMMPGGLGSTDEGHGICEGGRRATAPGHGSGAADVMAGTRSFPLYGLLGAVVMAISEAAMLAHIEPFFHWHTPIAWTGYILFVDAFVWKQRGTSWLRNSPAELLFVTCASVPLWVVFEGYNKYSLRNWY